MTPYDSPAHHDALAGIRALVGPKGWIEDAADMAPYLKEWRGQYAGQALAVVRPADTAETAAVIRLCAAAGIGVVPQGGNTGLVGGAVPGQHGRDILLSLQRLNRIRAIDPANDTLTVEAGVVLQAVQEAAAAADRLFPLSLGSEGSCQIGGCLSTNAGGMAVLRYGSMRELVLGLEVVLPDGRVWDGLRGLRKDNTGYDLKHLFVGAEGTLGVITAAVLRLFPRPRQSATALAALPDPAAAVALLTRARAACGEAVTAFELIPRLGVEFARRHVAGTTWPLEELHDWSLLIELSSPAAEPPLGEALEGLLAAAFEEGLVLDATIAASADQAARLWRLREAIVEGQNFEGGAIKHDIAVPVSSVPAFIARATAAVEACVPGVRIVAFGHVGRQHPLQPQPAGRGRPRRLPGPAGRDQPSGP